MNPEAKRKFMSMADKAQNFPQELDSLYEKTYIAHADGMLTEDEAVEVSGRLLDYMDLHEPREE